MEQLLTFCAGTDAGSLEGTAAFSPDCGVLRIRAALPAGILTDARAELPWAMEETERLFMNGYQTWTFCPEYTAADRILPWKPLPLFQVHLIYIYNSS